MIAFLLMDLSFYWWHVAEPPHAVLWRFHNVHHIDPGSRCLDRLPLSLWRSGHVGSLPRIVVALDLAFPRRRLRPTNWCFKPTRFFTIAMCDRRSASNALLATGCSSRRACTAFTTPRSEGETNSNYSVVFPWWDRFHRTLGLNIPQSEIVIGVPGYSTREDRKLLNGLLMPFRKQRDYWRTPDGKVPRRVHEYRIGQSDADGGVTRSVILLVAWRHRAAHFRAQKLPALTIFL